MAVLSHSIQPNGLTLQTSQGQLRLTPCTPAMVRVQYTLRPEFSDQPSLMVPARPAALVPFEVRDQADGLVFATSALTIEIDRQSGAFIYRAAGGELLTREPARGGKTLAPVEVWVSVFDENTTIDNRENVDGARAEASNIRQRLDRQAYQARLDFEWAPGEALYGLGSHEEGMFNLRGQHQYLYQQNMKVVIPVLVSTRGYGVVLDCYSLMTFHDDAFGSYLWCDVTAELDYYFIYGPEFDQVVGQVRALTGQAPLLPRWALGYIQSKERYVDQQELLAVVQEYRARQLPLDCIVLDWQSWTGSLWGQKTLDPQRFPDPRQLTADLHALHAHLMISIWPIMRPGGSNWQEMHDQGFLLGNQATYDAFNPAARACYWRQTNEGLFAQGIDAWWCDCTEPFEADWKGAVKPEPEERLRINTSQSKRYLDPAYINAYSLLHTQEIYEGQRCASTEKRVVNLTRSAYLGQQRYATVTWSGDIVASWETLRRQIAEGLNFCVTGMPYWTLDIGGFFVRRKPELWFWSGDYEAGVADLGYHELFVRWFQYGAFLPMFRAHGTDTPREVWRFGEPGEPFYEALAQALRLRYRLLPYLYSLAGWTTQHSYTLLRALPFDFRADPGTYDIRDQYMFGPALLVNPVTQPMAYTVGSQPLMGSSWERPVYLPAGAEWYDFWNDQKYAGGQTISAAAPLERLPLFVRAGSIVPMGPLRQYADDLPDAPLELHIYPGCDGEFELYEDEGDGYAYETGAFATTRICWEDAARRLIVEERAGSYPGMPAQRNFVVVLHAASAPVEARPVPYAGQRVVVSC